MTEFPMYTMLAEFPMKTTQTPQTWMQKMTQITSMMMMLPLRDLQ